MYKIIGKEKIICVPYNQASFADKSISVTVPMSLWSADTLLVCMGAVRLDFHPDGQEDAAPMASYNLVNWASCEQLWDGVKVSWKTYAKDRLDDMQFKLDEMNVALEKSQSDLAASQERVKMLTKAILDLGELYGNTQPVQSEETSSRSDDACPLDFTLTEVGTAACGTSGDPESSVTVADPDVPGTLTSADEPKATRRKKKTEEVETDG